MQKTIKANLLKNKGAKLKGLRIHIYGSQLPNFLTELFGFILVLVLCVRTYITTGLLI